MSALSKPCLTIFIKILNEDCYIAVCLDAAVPETQAHGREVMPVDLLSRDKTVAIARQYPIRIIKFERIEDRGCSAAVQLGYQYARDDFIYVHDAEMVLQLGFLVVALETLEADLGFARVDGKLLDSQVPSFADKNRILKSSSLSSVPKSFVYLKNGQSIGSESLLSLHLLYPSCIHVYTAALSCIAYKGLSDDYLGKVKAFLKGRRTELAPIGRITRDLESWSVGARKPKLFLTLTTI